MPASGPTPKAQTRISAKTISGTVRIASMLRRASCTASVPAPRLRAAGKASSSPAAAPIKVASAAMLAVSNSSQAQESRR